jgi:hypothetical protein
MIKKKRTKRCQKLGRGLGPQRVDPKSSSFSTGPLHVLESSDFRLRSAKLTDRLAKNTALSFMLGQYSGAPNQTKLELRTKKKSAKSYYCGNVIASLRLTLLLWGDHFGIPIIFGRSGIPIIFSFPVILNFHRSGHWKQLLSVMILDHLHTTYTYRCWEHVFVELAC